MKIRRTHCGAFPPFFLEIALLAFKTAVFTLKVGARRSLRPGPRCIIGACISTIGAAFATPASPAPASASGSNGLQFTRFPHAHQCAFVQTISAVDYDLIVFRDTGAHLGIDFIGDSNLTVLR